MFHRISNLISTLFLHFKGLQKFQGTIFLLKISAIVVDDQICGRHINQGWMVFTGNSFGDCSKITSHNFGNFQNPSPTIDYFEQFSAISTVPVVLIKYNTNLYHRIGFIEICLPIVLPLSHSFVLLYTAKGVFSPVPLYCGYFIPSHFIVVMFIYLVSSY